MRRPKTWLEWLCVAIGSCLVMIVGAALLGLSALMARVCTDGKGTAAENGRRRPFFASLPPVLNIAHRGASALAREHSEAAYDLALAQGAHVLELDLRLLRDGVLVVAHDRTLARTLGLEAAFAELTFAELERAAGSATPFSIDQVFTRFPSESFNLELKDERVEAASRLAQAIARHAANERVLVASAHHDVLVAFREATGGAVATSASAREALEHYTCYLLRRECPSAFSALQLPALDWLGLTGPRFIAAAQARGQAVHFWTVDDPGRMQQLLAAGADGIMTNRPDLLAPLLGGR